MVKSSVTNSTICAFCAILIVQQTMSHMVNVSAAYKQTVMAHPEWFSQDKETGAISLIDPDKLLDDAVNTENSH